MYALSSLLMQSSFMEEGAKRPEKARIRSMGRRKVEIKRIEDEHALQICFSKRRGGLNRKATTLSGILRGEAAVFTFTHHGNLHSYGTPSAGREGNDERADRVVLDYINHMRSREEEVQRRQPGKIVPAEGTSGAKYWWEMPIGDMGLHQLEDYSKELQELIGMVRERLSEGEEEDGEVEAEDSSDQPPPPPPSLEPGINLQLKL